MSNLPPTMPQSLINLIGEYGFARTDGASEIERIHRWELLIDGIKLYAGSYAEEAVRLEREAKARAEQDEIVNAAIEWYGSSHKDEPEHRLAMAVLRFKTAIARSQEGNGAIK